MSGKILEVHCCVEKRRYFGVRNRRSVYNPRIKVSLHLTFWIDNANAVDLIWQWSYKNEQELDLDTQLCQMPTETSLKY